MTISMIKVNIIMGIVILASVLIAIWMLYSPNKYEYTGKIIINDQGDVAYLDTEYLKKTDGDRPLSSTKSFYDRNFQEVPVK